ncbi:MAG TPA: DegT/DnrJ/EryC1/StrS family aminotransferase [Candidatus Eisenbacteria bacterium]|nr:DegT/DnrJ/EryC1/StrS family aminotransferase [Candidatus Eisenbacteria bacterium]
MNIIKVPYLDLQAQYRAIKPEIDAAIGRVLESCQFVLGPEVSDFEKAFAAYCGASECIALNSGTSALHLALLAAGVGPGDEVITTPFTFVASVAAILYSGARPVLVDIDPRSFTLDPSKIEASVTSRTKVLLPVHLYGQPADMDPIMEIARRHNLIVIEDAAQAHGAQYKGRSVGSIGHMACFSFYPGKNLGAYGEGGAVTTNNSEYARAIRMLRDWGQDRKYHHLLRGYNYRMEGFQGAVLGVKLRHLEQWTEARRNLVQQYNGFLAECELELPTEMSWARHVYHVYTIRSKERDRLQKSLADEGIQTGIHYPTPVHLQPAYADLGYGPGSFPKAESAAKQVLSLPLYPELSMQSVALVADTVKKVVGNKVTAVMSH